MLWAVSKVALDPANPIVYILIVPKGRYKISFMKLQPGCVT